LCGLGVDLAGGEEEGECAAVLLFFLPRLLFLHSCLLAFCDAEFRRDVCETVSALACVVLFVCPGICGEEFDGLAGRKRIVPDFLADVDGSFSRGEVAAFFARLLAHLLAYFLPILLKLFPGYTHRANISGLGLVPKARASLT
jgi:hypothetical protein